MDIFDIALAKQLAGGGQPLYRHNIWMTIKESEYEAEICATYYSCNAEPFTFETLCEYVADVSVVASGNLLITESNTNARVVSLYAEDGCLYVEFGVPTDNVIYDVQILQENAEITDTVTEIGTASVSGGGGSCQIVDLGQLNGHGADGEGYAESTIIELLKPASVPNGKYLYTYYLTGECGRQDATIAICHKSAEEITCTQITSGGEYRRFWYNFADESADSACFVPLGGKPLYLYNIRISDSKKEFDIQLRVIVDYARDITNEQAMANFIDSNINNICGCTGLMLGSDNVSYIPVSNLEKEPSGYIYMKSATRLDGYNFSRHIFGNRTLAIESTYAKITG